MRCLWMMSLALCFSSLQPGLRRRYIGIGTGIGIGIGTCGFL